MNGKQIWKFQDTSPLHSPRGVVVDNQGFVFVAGEKSGNIVVIAKIIWLQDKKNNILNDILFKATYL
jgi:hypothetical protein